jgi:endonuclease YncB( thermonuclease family)
MSEMRISFSLLTGICLLFLCAGLHAEGHLGNSAEGRVIKITDGNTLTVMLPDSFRLNVELANIDAPEKNQPHFQEAKQALSDKAFTEDVRVEIVSWKKKDLVIGMIVLDGEYINSWMVAEGHAWVYPQDSDDPELMELQMEAKASFRGFWALSDVERVPPWEWRQGKRIGTRERMMPVKAYSCGSKTSCREMTSCDEAKFYLRSCYLLRLDDDNNGIPCESLCD